VRIAAFEAGDFNTVTLLVSDKQDYNFGQRLPKRSTCLRIRQSDEICGGSICCARNEEINKKSKEPPATGGRQPRAANPDPRGVTLAPLSGYGEPPDPIEKSGRGGSMNIAVGDISDAGQTAALASFAARLGFADLPDDVVAKAKICFRDALACCLFGVT